MRRLSQADLVLRRLAVEAMAAALCRGLRVCSASERNNFSREQKGGGHPLRNECEGARSVDSHGFDYIVQFYAAESGLYNSRDPVPGFLYKYFYKY